MLNGYILGTEKLSARQFKDKYWMGGEKEYVYQFHSMDITDGLDERQQLLINNDRALHNLVRGLWKKQFKDINTMYYLKSDLEKNKKVIAALVIINTAIVGMVVKIIHSLNNQ